MRGFGSCSGEGSSVKASRVAGILLLAYGLLVFGDQGAGELKTGGKALFSNLFIYGSAVRWPAAGFEALQGLVLALVGVFILRLKPRDRDPSELSSLWMVMDAGADSLTFFFGVCFVWVILVYVREPGELGAQVIQYLYGTPITNILVFNLSAIMLALLGVYRARRRVFRWLPSWFATGAEGLRFGTALVCLGVLILAAATYAGISIDSFGVLLKPLGSACSEGCYFVSTSDLVAAGVGAVMFLVGTIVSTERLFPRERQV